MIAMMFLVTMRMTCDFGDDAKEIHNGGHDYDADDQDDDDHVLIIMLAGNTC